MPRLPLFDGPAPAPPVVERLGIDSPEYHAFWTSFRAAVDGQSFTYSDADDRVTAYAKNGHRVGRLFRPLACVREKR